jgi:chromosome segregation ATPase
MRVAKEAQKNLQGQIQFLNTDLGKAYDRAKDKARELGDTQKQLLSNRGLLRQRDTEVKNLKERLKAAEQLQSGNLRKGAKDADVAADHERELEEIKKLLEEKEATIKSLLGKQDQRAGEVADLQKDRDGLLRKVNSESDKTRHAIETEKQAAEAEAAKRQKTELELWDVKQQLNKLRDQEKGWTNEMVGLQKKLEDAKNAAAKEAKDRADVEEDLKKRVCEKLVDELHDRVKEAEKNGVAAAAGEVEGQRKKGEELRAQEEQKWSRKTAEVWQKYSAAKERERLAIERERTLQGQLRNLRESRVAELQKVRGEIEAELSKQVESIDRMSMAKVKGVEDKLAKCQANFSNSAASLRRLSVADGCRREQVSKRGKTALTLQCPCTLRLLTNSRRPLENVLRCSRKS